MSITVGEVVRQLTTIKNHSSENGWKKLLAEMNEGNSQNPCYRVEVSCMGIRCRECIFEVDTHRDNISKTIKILEDNPHIIPTVELLC